MKKIVIAFVIMMFMCFSVPLSANAYTLEFQDYPDFELTSVGTIEKVDDTYLYEFEITVLNYPCLSSASVYYGDFDLLGNCSSSEFLFTVSSSYFNLEYGDDGSIEKTTITYSFESDTLYYDYTDVNSLRVRLGMQIGTVYFTYYFIPITFELINIEENEPTVTPAPTVTPIPVPKLTLNINVDGTSVECNYFTGGMNSVESCIELYWAIDGSDSSLGTSICLDAVTFVDGSGVHSYDDLKDGEYYFYYLVYTYTDSSGEEYAKSIFSDFFICDTDSGDIVIYNFSTLMKWVWNSIFGLEITYEGYTVSFKQIYMFALIVSLGIGLFLSLVGVNFNFSHDLKVDDDGSVKRRKIDTKKKNK